MKVEDSGNSGPLMFLQLTKFTYLVDIGRYVFEIYFLDKVQLFQEGHKNLRHPLYDFDIYLVNVKTKRMMAHFVANL